MEHFGFRRRDSASMNAFRRNSTYFVFVVVLSLLTVIHGHYLKRHLVCQTADYQVQEIVAPQRWAFLNGKSAAESGSETERGGGKIYDQEDTHLQIRKNLEDCSESKTSLSDSHQFPLLSVHDFSGGSIIDFAVPHDMTKAHEHAHWTKRRLSPSFVFSRRFGGFASEADILRNVEGLKEALRENEEKLDEDAFYVLSHNRSSVPQNRWNEVWIGLAAGVTAPSCNRIFVEKRVDEQKNESANENVEEETNEEEEGEEEEEEEIADVDFAKSVQNGKNGETKGETMPEEEERDEEGEKEEEEEEEEEEERNGGVAEEESGADGESSAVDGVGGAEMALAPRSSTSVLALARHVGACSIVEAVFKGTLELKKIFGVVTRPSAGVVIIRVHKSSSSSSSPYSSTPCTLRSDEHKRRFTIFVPIDAKDVDDLKARIEDVDSFVAEFPAGKGTLKYEFGGRPTDGRVDEAMVALMDEIDCTAALVGQLEMTILTDDKPWNKDVKSEIWVTKTQTIRECLRKQKEKDADKNKIPALGSNPRGISPRSLNIDEDKTSLKLSVKSLKNLAQFPWIQTTVSACTVAEAYFKGYLPLQKYKHALEFRGLIDSIPENNTLLLMGMDFRVARQKKPATAAECSVATSRGQRRYDVILLLPYTELGRINAAFWPKKEAIKVGKVEDLPFESVFVKSFHQWPKEKYISHYIKDLSQNLYRDEKCFRRDKIYVSYAGGHLPWRPLRRDGRHEIWIPGCHSNNVIHPLHLDDAVAAVADDDVTASDAADIDAGHDDVNDVIMDES